MWKQLPLIIAVSSTVINAKEHNVVLSTEDVGGDSASLTNNRPLTVQLDRENIPPELLKKLKDPSKVAFSGPSKNIDLVNGKEYSAYFKKFHRNKGTDTTEEDDYEEDDDDDEGECGGGEDDGGDDDEGCGNDDEDYDDEDDDAVGDEDDGDDDIVDDDDEDDYVEEEDDEDTWCDDDEEDE